MFPKVVSKHETKVDRACLYNPVIHVAVIYWRACSLKYDIASFRVERHSKCDFMLKLRALLHNAPLLSGFTRDLPCY
jgi:hypothetical protein